MSTPTHFAAGVLITHLLASNNLIAADQLQTLYLWSGVMANAPDIDGLNPKRIKNHRRNSLLHFPSVWLLAFIFWGIWILITGNDGYALFFWLGLINIIGHFVLDTFNFNAGIQWLAPFSFKEFSFFRTHLFCVYHIPRFVRYYLLQPLMVAEAVIIITGGIVFFRHYTGWPRPVQAKTSVIRKNTLKTWLENRKFIKPSLSSSSN